MIYLASPFWDHDEAVRTARQAEIIKLTKALIARGMLIFCPIAYSGIIKGEEGFQPKQGWYDFDLGFLAKCDSMIVAEQPGWKQSKGVKLEIEFARKHMIPIMHMDYQTIKTMTE